MLRSFALATVVLAACSDSEVHELVVASNKRPCSGFGPQLCNIVAEDGGEPRNFHDGIVGFTFAWGVESTLRVRVEPISNPPQDGGSARTILEEVVDERAEPVGSTFELELFQIEGGPEVWFTPTATGVDMMSEPVACDAALCTELVDLGGSEARVAFEYTGDPATPIRATAVLP